jgi:hypothetical protein
MSDKAIRESLATIITEIKEMRSNGAAASLQMDNVAERLDALAKTLDEHKLQNDAKFASQRDLIDALTYDLDSLKGVELDVKDFKEMVGIQFSALANKSGDRKADPDVVKAMVQSAVDAAVTAVKAATAASTDALKADLMAELKAAMKGDAITVNSEALSFGDFMGIALTNVIFSRAAKQPTESQHAGDPSETGISQSDASRRKLTGLPDKFKVQIKAGDLQKYEVDVEHVIQLVKALNSFAKLNAGMLPFQFWTSHISADAILAMQNHTTRLFRSHKRAVDTSADMSRVDPPVRVIPHDDESDEIETLTTEREWYSALVNYISVNGVGLQENLQALEKYAYQLSGSKGPQVSVIEGRIALVFDRLRELVSSSEARSLREPDAMRVILTALKHALPKKLVKRVLDGRGQTYDNATLSPKLSITEWQQVVTSTATDWFSSVGGELECRGHLYIEASDGDEAGTKPKADKAGKDAKSPAPKGHSASGAAGGNAAGGAAGGGPPGEAGGGAAAEKAKSSIYTDKPCYNCGGDHTQSECDAKFCGPWRNTGRHEYKACKFKEYHTAAEKGKNMKKNAKP